MVCSGSPAPHFVNNDYVTAEIISSTSHVHHEMLAWLWARICAVPLYERYHESPAWCCTGATLEWPHDYVMCGYVMALLWLCYVYAVAATARREAVLRLPGQPGEKKRVCSPYGSSSLLPASQLAPCLPWIQPTLWTARQLPLWAGSAIHQASVFLKHPENSTVHCKFRTTALGWLPTMDLG